jgi:hypothetical protein
MNPRLSSNPVPVWQRWPVFTPAVAKFDSTDHAACTKVRSPGWGDRDILSTKFVIKRGGPRSENFAAFFK